MTGELANESISSDRRLNKLYDQIQIFSNLERTETCRHH